MQIIECPCIAGYEQLYSLFHVLLGFSQSIISSDRILNAVVERVPSLVLAELGLLKFMRTFCPFRTFSLRIFSFFSLFDICPVRSRSKISLSRSLKIMYHRVIIINFESNIRRKLSSEWERIIFKLLKNYGSIYLQHVHKLTRCKRFTAVQLQFRKKDRWYTRFIQSSQF